MFCILYQTYHHFQSRALNKNQIAAMNRRELTIWIIPSAWCRKWSKKVVLKREDKSSMMQVKEKYKINIVDHRSPTILNIICSSPTIAHIGWPLIIETNTTYNRQIPKNILGQTPRLYAYRIKSRRSVVL